MLQTPLNYFFIPPTYTISDKYYEPPLMQVIPSACDKCPDNVYEVSDQCRSCVAKACVAACPKNAISVVNGKTVIDQEEYSGITNIGVKPTISGEEAKGIETHLFDYEGDLYGRELVVEFFAFERAERRFESLEDLQQQLKKDVLWGKEHAKK